MFNYHFCVFFCVQLFANFSKSRLFEKKKKKGAKIEFFKFLCFEFKIWKFSFFRFAKTLLKIWFYHYFGVFVVEREEKGRKMITGISGFGFFVPKWPFRDAHLFSNEPCWTPIFIVFFGRALFGPRCKKRKFWTPTKKGKNWLITEKFFFGVFPVFCLLVFYFLFFFGKFKGQTRWPEGHLTLP